MGGIGEEEPDGFGEHSEGGCGEVHNTEATSAAREESNVLAGKKEGRERDFLLRSASGCCEARDRALHRDEVAVKKGEEAHLVHCFGATLVRCVDAAGKERSRSIQRRALVDMEAALVLSFVSCPLSFVGWFLFAVPRMPVRACHVSKNQSTTG